MVANGCLRTVASPLQRVWRRPKARATQDEVLEIELGGELERAGTAGTEYVRVGTVGTPNPALRPIRL